MKRKLITLLIVALISITGCSNDTSKKDSENSEPEIVNLMIEKVDDSHFYVVATAEGSKINYAYYVYKDGEVLEKYPYKKDAHFSYTAKEPGVYKVAVYVRDQYGNKVRKNTKEVEINI